MFEIARDWYLWYDELAAIDAADFDSADSYLAALTAPLAEDFRDPGFSYLTTRSEDEDNFSTGAFVGFGFRYSVDGAGRYLISDVFESGTAFAAGFRRGAEMLAVDRGSGFETLRELEAQGESAQSIFGESRIGIERGFRLRIADDTVDLQIVKTELDVPPIATAPRLLERPGLSSVGYLHLRSFTQSANAELANVFADFAREGITDYIIDLRYNSGGVIGVAEGLLNLLGGRIAPGQVAYRLRHSDIRASENFTARYARRSESVAPLRIAFITSGATASASELLINSLAAEVDVVLIGSDTLGKAVGQYAFDQPGCDTRLRLVSFEMLNGDGIGGYFTGLADTGRFTLCRADDRYAQAFGSPQETLTAGALRWLNEGSCDTLASAGISSPTRGLRREPGPIEAPPVPDRRSQWVQ